MNAPLLASQLRELKLSGMAEALNHQLEQGGTYEDMAFSERLGLLLEQEILNRKNRREERLIQRAHFRIKARIQDIDCEHSRNIQKSQIAQLAQNEWLRRSQNLLLSGPCGSGKTYLACALGHNACLFGYSGRDHRLSRLFLELTQAKADGSYHKLLKQLESINLLILDDWGLEPLKPAYRNDLMEIMDDRHEHRSTIVISQLPTSGTTALETLFAITL